MPLVSPVMARNPVFDTALQPQPAPVVTVTLPEPPALVNVAEVGLSE